MYGALWRMLPGPAWVRVLVLVVLASAIIAALFLWVFPWVQTVLGLDQVVVGGP